MCSALMLEFKSLPCAPAPSPLMVPVPFLLKTGEAGRFWGLSPALSSTIIRDCQPGVSASCIPSDMSRVVARRHSNPNSSCSCVSVYVSHPFLTRKHDAPCSRCRDYGQNRANGNRRLLKYQYPDQEVYRQMWLSTLWPVLDALELAQGLHDSRP